MDNNSFWDRLIDMGHTISLASIAAALAGLLPPIAAVLAIIWYCIIIYESKTVQALLERQRTRRKAKKLARLTAQRVILSAKIKEATLEPPPASSSAITASAMDPIQDPPAPQSPQ